MNGPLFDDLLDQLRGAPLQQIAGDLGLAPDAATAAIETALRVLLGAMHKQAVAPGGADALLSTLQFEHRGIDPTNALSTAIAGGGAQGDAIVGDLLGEHRRSAAEGVGESSGIGTDRAGRLLAVLAPAAMAYVARRLFTSRQADGASTPEATADGLRAALGDEILGMRRERDDPDARLATGADGVLRDVGSMGPLPVQTAEMRSPRPSI